MRNIKEQGLRKGWFDGTFIFIRTIALVLAASIIKMKNKDSSNPDIKSELKADIDNMNGRMQKTALMVSILALIILFLRYMAGKVDETKGYRPEPKGKPTTLEFFAKSFEKILNQSTCTSKVFKLLCVSMVGFTEGVPCVITLALQSQNHLPLSSNTTDPQVVANLPLLARIYTNQSCNSITGGSYEDLMLKNIQSCIQLFLIMTVSSNLINFIMIAAFGDAPLRGVQLIWLNLAVPFLGGFALLTKPVLRLDSVDSRSSLITSQMIRNIIFQVLYQTICILILESGVVHVLATGDKKIQSMVSNSFTLCQIFNLFNARELKYKNFFEGIHKHIKLWVAAAIFISIQVLIGISKGDRLNWKWGLVCVLMDLVV